MAQHRLCTIDFLRRLAVFTMAAASMLMNGMQARADETEIRNFSITIKGKPAGRYQMRIATRQDGKTMVTGHAQVDYRLFKVVRYSYSYDGTEFWQNGRLLQLDSSSNDDGTAFTVSARAQENALRVQVNGQVHDTRADVWTTTYWKLADPKFRNGPVPLIDADTGRDIAGYLHYLGMQPVPLGGQLQNCAHYRVTGTNLQVDLWYDAQERLVRESSLEQGQRTILELQSVSRAP
jgi:hypothetical protein